MITVFVRYLNWYLGRHFHAVLISRDAIPYVPPERPLVIYANHPSWWDPLLFILLGETLFEGRRGFGPMEAQSLKRYSIFRRLGIFGIDLNSARGGVEFIVQSTRILEDSANILWLTAQGAFTDVRQRPIKIQDGLAYLAMRIPGLVVMPLAVEYPFWNESRPEALCRFGIPIDMDTIHDAQRAPGELNKRFEGALSQTMDELARSSIERNPALFHSILSGSSGVGGFYDGWRRVRSWSRGRRFNASHGEPP